MNARQVESVDALSLDEALLLARELPHLRDLIQGSLPGVDREVSRRLALGVLNVAQGHPKLLDLADGQTADYLHVLAAWAIAVAGTLAPGAGPCSGSCAVSVRCCSTPANTRPASSAGGRTPSA